MNKSMNSPNQWREVRAQVRANLQSAADCPELLSNLVFEISGSCSELIVFCGFNTVFEFNASDNFGQIIKAS
jgi:hypothetical protein